MKTKFLFALLCTTAVAANAQDENCNQKVWPRNFGDPIPQGVCIPQGMFNYITAVYDRTDINGDGLEDFICDWNVKPLDDGDSIYVSIYLQNSDSTFSHFRTFSHLYPIYFARYDLGYIPEDTTLIPILKGYEDTYPLIGLRVEKAFIILEIEFDAEAYWRITYKYDDAIKSWRYEKCEEVFRNESGASLRDMAWAFGPTIDDFTYFYWDKER
jgi:hypothetical protein